MTHMGAENARKLAQTYRAGRETPARAESFRAALPDYWAGAGIGKMLDIRQPPGVVTRTIFIRNLVGCAGCPAAPMVNRIGT